MNFHTSAKDVVDIFQISENIHYVYFPILEPLSLLEELDSDVERFTCLSVSNLMKKLAKYTCIH